MSTFQIIIFALPIAVAVGMLVNHFVEEVVDNFSHWMA